MVRTRSLRTQSARHRVDHDTICGRSCANSEHYKPLCACVDRIFVNPKFVAPAARKNSGRVVDKIAPLLAPVKPRHRAGRLPGRGSRNSCRTTGPAVEQLPTPKVPWRRWRSLNCSRCRPSFRPHFQQPPRPPFVGVSLRTEQCRLQPTLRRRPLP
jgi:hypothetical protein